MRVTHLVCTSHFAGVERHVAVLAAAQHDRGDEVTVLGGDVTRMRAAIDRPGVRVVAVDGVARAMRLLSDRRGPSPDVVATHMTAADLAAASAPTLRRTPVVSTRHFAAERGSSPHARAAVTAVSGRITADIAVSRYIADAAGNDSSVVYPGVPDRPAGPPAVERDRTVLMVQRLEPEKATDIGVRAFAVSGLATQGWRLAIAGSGSERRSLATLARELGVDAAVDFLGQREDVADLMARTGLLVATCPVEGLGLSVLEAMASGLPVVASGAGGHLESVGPTTDAALFPPGDVDTAAALLGELAGDTERRDRYGDELRERQRSTFSVSTQAEATDEVYRYATAAKRPRPARAAERTLVVISLEPWDRVWRRNQHLVAGLLRADPGLRALFVEPATDPLHATRTGDRPRAGRGLRRGPHLPGVDPDALWLLEPTKVLPRRADPHQDERWAGKIRRAAGRLGMTSPVLWVNDPHGAEVMTATGWSTLYDITDDWLEAARDPVTLGRLARHEDLLMEQAREVVVCSTGLERSKSPRRPVTLLRNAVDPAAALAMPRPTDLPVGPTAVYVGTLHSDRLDLDLCLATAAALGGDGTLVLVGPDALTPDEGERLTRAGVVRLGAKDRREVPGYLQHADVLVVPHVVDDFTDSLDPIKLYEYRAVGRPVVSTPVAGFRESAGPRLHVTGADAFPTAVRAAVPATDRFPTGADPSVPSWTERVREMRAVLERTAATDHEGDETATLPVPLSARIRLGHAVVQSIADRHFVDLLHIKGAALDPALIHPGRCASDVDVLVRPEHVSTLLRSLEAAGFTATGRFATSSPFEHSVTLLHPLWGHVDVHRLYPGISLSPQEAFERLWRGRARVDIAGRSCSVPEVSAQVLVLVLHAARNAPGGQPDRDVEHAWTHADAGTREAVEALVREMKADVAFAVGTGEGDSLPPTPERDLWRLVSRPDGRLREWRARIAAAPDLAARVRLVARLPLVNTDHLAARLGRRPTRREIAVEFVDRIRRAVVEQRGRR